MNEIDVVAAVILRDGRCLLARRPPGDAQAGCWEFPGGKQERGEAPAQALARELREELGIEARVGEEIHSISHDYPERRVHLHFLRVTDFTGEPSGLDGQEVAWQDLATLADLPMSPPDHVFALVLSRS